MKTRFVLTEEQKKRILDASQPTPVMYLSGGTPMFNSPQENANRVWKALGEEMGFIWDTVEPPGPEEAQNVFFAEEKPK